MRNYKIIIVSLLFVLNLSCISTIPKKESYSSSAIAIYLSSTGLGHSEWDIDAVKTLYFVKLDDNNNILSNYVIESNFEYNNQFYLLNAEPGIYAAIGFNFELETGNNKKLILFSKDFIQSTVTEVGTNRFMYIGDYSISIISKEDFTINDEADEAQKYYCKLLAPDFLNPSILSKIGKVASAVYLNQKFQYLSLSKKISEDRSKEATIRFYKEVKSIFSSGSWSSIVQDEIDKI